MVTKKKLTLDHSWIVRPTVIIAATASVIFIYMVYTLASPSQQVWTENINVRWVFRHLFIDIFAIELLTTVILYGSMFQFAKWMKLHELELNFKAILRYQLFFLPLLLTAFFLFNPITQTVRYCWFYFPKWLPEIYLEEYFYSVPLYLRYLVPVLLLGYGVLNANLLRELQRQSKHLLPDTPEPPPSLVVYDNRGERFVALSDLQWVEVKERKYFAVTRHGRFRLRQKLSELETLLPPPQFFRINRSVIVNWKWVECHSYWEHEKYVLRMRCGQEFVMTRKRWAAIKSKL